jgi:hypothetical protein
MVHLTQRELLNKKFSNMQALKDTAIKNAMEAEAKAWRENAERTVFEFKQSQEEQKQLYQNLAHMGAPAAASREFVDKVD